jgi:adenylate cyclase
LLGDEGLARSEAFIAFAKGHASLLADYRARRWDAAERGLDAGAAAAAGYGLAPLYQRYRASIRTFRLHPPADDWDGVTVAETK